MKTKAQLLAWHGWAFDRTCWKPWKNFLTNGITLKLGDRGYWGNPQTPKLKDDNVTNIIFVHSFGLHLCPNEQLKSADVVVIFGGFREFHPVATQFKRRSKLILNKMIQTLQEEPQQVLEEFMENAYKPDKAPDLDESSFNADQLLHDLHTLNQSTLDVEPLKEAQKICILHGSLDAIVPKSKGRELYNIFQENASYFEVKGAGHALPFTHLEQCWAFIKPEINDFIDIEIF